MKDYIENLPLIDTHMHRISHLREPDFGQIAGDPKDVAPAFFRDAGIKKVDFTPSR